MLVEGLLGALLLLVVLEGALAWSTRSRVDAVAVGLTEALRIVESTVERLDEVVDTPGAAIVESVRAEVVEVIEDVIGSMHVPTAADHLMGALGTWVQAKVMRDLGPGISQLVAQNDAEPESAAQGLEDS